MGEEVRIKFPVLNWAVYNCRASSVNAEAKLSKPGEGPELCTKISQAELKKGVEKKKKGNGRATVPGGSTTLGVSGLCKGSLPSTLQLHSLKAFGYF